MVKLRKAEEKLEQERQKKERERKLLDREREQRLELEKTLLETQTATKKIRVELRGEVHENERLSKDLMTNKRKLLTTEAHNQNLQHEIVQKTEQISRLEEQLHQARNNLETANQKNADEIKRREETEKSRVLEMRKLSVMLTNMTETIMTMQPKAELFLKEKQELKAAYDKSIDEVQWRKEENAKEKEKNQKLKKTLQEKEEWICHLEDEIQKLRNTSGVPTKSTEEERKLQRDRKKASLEKYKKVTRL